MEARIMMPDPKMKELAPDEQRRLVLLAELAESERSEVDERLSRMDRAAKERTLSGRLRRAVLDSLVPPHVLASDCHIELDCFLDWQEGTGELPVTRLEEIARRLGLAITLVQSSEAETVAAG